MNSGCGWSTQNPDSGDFRSLPLDRFQAFRVNSDHDLGCGRSTRNPDSGDFRSLTADFRALTADVRSIGFRLSGRILAKIWAGEGAHGTLIPGISTLFRPIGFRLSGWILATIWAVVGAHGAEPSGTLFLANSWP